MLVASNLLPIKLLHFAYNATKLCPNGITLFGLNCRVILEWFLRAAGQRYALGHKALNTVVSKACR